MHCFVWSHRIPFEHLEKPMRKQMKPFLFRVSDYFSRQTLSTSFDASICLTKFSFSKSWITGRVESLYVTILERQSKQTNKRTFSLVIWIKLVYLFFKLASLSSVRPLPLPRSRHRATQVYMRSRCFCPRWQT